MGIYIKGMEMPTRCAECWLMDGEDSWCTGCQGRHLYPEYRYGIKDRPGWCPLVEIPPHGDLIDRDVLEKYKELVSSAVPGGKLTREYVPMAAVRNVKTIIPAEEV